MFIARLTDEPDIRIFGRAIGMEHEPGRDDATSSDIARRDWVVHVRFERLHARALALAHAPGVRLAGASHRASSAQPARWRR